VSGREELARHLVGGWREAADELCTNVWFGDAGRVDADGRDAFVRTVRPWVDPGPMPEPLVAERLAHAWSDPLVRHDLLRVAAAVPIGELPTAVTGDGGDFGRRVASDAAAARPALDRLLDRTEPGGPAAEHFAVIFRDRVLPDLTTRPVAKVAPDAAFRDSLAGAASRMARATPELFASAWSFVGDIIAIGDAGDDADGPLPDAFSQPGLSGVVFFTAGVLDLPWHGEVTLLHEAVHQKLYTLLLTRPLYERDGVDDELEVPIPWRATTWPPRRVISALHAYVHMTVAFRALIEDALATGRPLTPEDGGEDDPLALVQVHTERMLHLAGAAGAFDRDVLAEAGLDLVRWLRLVADDLVGGADRPHPGLGVWP
jgi:hypothetical protein